MRDGDVLALCSDGAWGPIGDDSLVTHLTAAQLSQSVPRLLDDAERRAGPNADNLSMVAMCWHDEDNAGPASAESISTRTMELDDFTTRLDMSSMGKGPTQDLDEDEIERAIREINATIRKFDQKR